MSFQRHALWFFLLITLTGAIPSDEDSDVTLNNHLLKNGLPNGYRLSKDVYPTKYRMRLEPNIVPNQFTFKGEIEIGVTVESNTLYIVLHAMDLIIDEKYTELVYADGSKVNVNISATYEEDKQFYKLQFDHIIHPGNYILKMKYSGLLHDDTYGFYRSSYTNDQGEEVWLATTQFEPTYARRAFPCFDEPSFKAKFKISITHLDNYTAVSNMPAISKTRPPGDDSTKWTTVFEETPIMSTYLVAFVVSDFKYLSNAKGTFRVFARSNKIHLGRFCQTIGPKVLAALENFTDIAYELPKMDNFAIPRSDNYAMENWGLVTYRESKLLYDEKRAMTRTKQRIASVISHEFAHQWFGNLVGREWWSFTWLNEGFANYFQYLITDQVEPPWRMMDQFVIENLQKKAFVHDDDETQHAMNVPVEDPVQISSNFDSIPHSKAGCVIRMFSHVLTPTVFQKGLQNYLRKMAYKAATPNDLIKELVSVGTDIKFLDKALESWITQPGYPVITVIRNHTTGNAVISQKRFLTHATKPRTEKWYVPVNIVTKDDTEKFLETKPIHWLHNDTKGLTLSGFENGSWIILNSQQTGLYIASYQYTAVYQHADLVVPHDPLKRNTTENLSLQLGYYRVNYDVGNWKLIIDYLKNPNLMENIHVLNRAQLLDDSFHLAQAGELTDHSIFLELTKYLQHERDYIPWSVAHRVFDYLSELLANTKGYHLFKLYIQRLTKNLEEDLGYTEKSNETDDVKLNRVNLIRTACDMGSAKCLAATHEMLIEHVVKSNKTSADLQSVVLCAGMRSADTELWGTAYNYTLMLDKDSKERATLEEALDCSPDAAVIKMNLDKKFHIKTNVDRSNILKAVNTSLLSYFQDNFRTIVKQVDGVRNMIPYVMKIRATITTSEQIQRLEDLINDLPDDDKPLANLFKEAGLMKAEKKRKWMKKYTKAVTTFLDAQDLVDASDADDL